MIDELLSVQARDFAMVVAFTGDGGELARAETARTIWAFGCARGSLIGR